MTVAVRRAPPISNAVFAALLFVFVEIMFFAALISSFVVIRRGRVIWDIPEGIHLPVLAGGFNTLVLLFSGLFIVLATMASKARKDPSVVHGHILRAAVLAGLFIAFQAFWGMKLMHLGLTMESSIFGACYFLLIGAHGLHVLIGIAAMAVLHFQSQKKIELSSLRALQVFWLFVVGIWPVLYAQLYF
jgi:heme/copper-type cytochrome/quinol oxidase subunit 3